MARGAAAMAARAAASHSTDLGRYSVSAKVAKPKLALVRGVPETFSRCITMSKPHSAIDVELARQQHFEYVSILRGLVDQVVELPADDSFPDCPFIEDTAVVIGSRALITRPGASSRRGEIEEIRSALRDLGFAVSEVEPPGTLDGGDVLYTEGTLFVGKSSRTNSKGIEALAQTFPEIPVVPIDVAETLHLKSVLSPLGLGTFLAEENSASKEMLDSIQKASDSANPNFRCVFTPTQGAANILWVGKTLIYPSAYPSGDLPALYASFAEHVIPVDISEFHKGDGGLTCLSIIVP